MTLQHFCPPKFCPKGMMRYFNNIKGRLYKKQSTLTVPDEQQPAVEERAAKHSVTSETKVEKVTKVMVIPLLLLYSEDNLMMNCLPVCLSMWGGFTCYRVYRTLKTLKTLKKP